MDSDTEWEEETDISVIGSERPDVAGRVEGRKYEEELGIQLTGKEGESGVDSVMMADQWIPELYKDTGHDLGVETDLDNTEEQ